MDPSAIEERVLSHHSQLEKIWKSVEDLGEKVSNIRVQVALIVGAFSVLQTIAVAFILNNFKH